MLAAGATFGFFVCLVPGMKASFQVVARKQAATLSDVKAQANEKSVLAMLASKDASNLRVILQLPVALWPEVPDILKFSAYQHLLPYLLDRVGSTTRWSYGLSRLQPVFYQIAKAAEVGNKSMTDSAIKFGYDGVLIEKSAFSKDDLVTIERGFLELGAVVLFNDDIRELVRLPVAEMQR